MNIKNEKRNIRSLIIGYVKTFPNCSSVEICEKLHIDNSLAHLHLKELINDGILQREKISKHYAYILCPGIYVEATFIPAVNPTIAKILEGEALAHTLADRGLLRRAATVLTGLLDFAETEAEFKRITTFRKKCLVSAKRSRLEAIA